MARPKHIPIAFDDATPSEPAPNINSGLEKLTVPEAVVAWLKQSNEEAFAEEFPKEAEVAFDAERRAEIEAKACVQCGMRIATVCDRAGRTICATCLAEAAGTCPLCKIRQVEPLHHMCVVCGEKTQGWKSTEAHDEMIALARSLAGAKFPIPAAVAVPLPSLSSRKEPVMPAMSPAAERALLRASWDSVLMHAAPFLGAPGPHRIYVWSKRPGMGKSFFEKALREKFRFERELYNLGLTQDSAPSDLLGFMELDGMKTYFEPGPATLAMGYGNGHGGILRIDELPLASNSCWSTLHQVLDDVEIARVKLPGKEWVQPKEGFLVLATGNLPPEVLPRPLADRFDITLHADKPAKGIFDAIQSPKAKAAVRTAYVEDSHGDFDRVEAFSPRRVLAFEKMQKAGMSTYLAARLTWDRWAEQVMQELECAGL